MKVAVMQPYFFPYIGYFQLISSVDLFVLYDNIKYAKKGWINRNRMLQNGKDMIFSLPLKRDSDSLDVRGRELATDFDCTKFLSQIRGAYLRAPYFKETFQLIETVMQYPEHNLFRFLFNSITKVCEHLGISTQIKISSDISIDHALKNQDKVLALCGAVKASTYINAIGGIELYKKSAFQKRSLELKFIKSKPLDYVQFDNQFVPWLSIIDVMMFNPKSRIVQILQEYELV
ncbi:MAG: hypothetical protein A2X34_01295 [Elusimicrobia bacterium GWC2_51_8]|nr:MAG: hypothetical protein A2X33_04150 [Elusimicrobia bacterium GWA2_51_34]OGR63431.1 MAG: hypothetical protein A2X34_01295 [Elusimicrobia bacterium GWC2_51_8]HAF96499.1 hypothetical protein [Elusimicrobiota bacterium]HCE97578.1 hypothetical protein [Elusimicrobiota bacterium]